MAAGPRPGGRQLIESLSLPRVVLARHLQVSLVLVCRELGQQGAEGRLRIADETEVDLGPPAELLTPHIDLDDRRLLGKNCWYGKSEPIIRRRSQAIMAW